MTGRVDPQPPRRVGSVSVGRRFPGGRRCKPFRLPIWRPRRPDTAQPARRRMAVARSPQAGARSLRPGLGSSLLRGSRARGSDRVPARSVAKRCQKKTRCFAGLPASGAAVAGRLLIEALLPGLKKFSRGEGFSRGGAERRRTGSVLLARAWERICSYPLGRRPNRIAANILYDTLADAPPRARSRAAAPPQSLGAKKTAWNGIACDGNVDALLASATREDVLTGDRGGAHPVDALSTDDRSAKRSRVRGRLLATRSRWATAGRAAAARLAGIWARTERAPAEAFLLRACKRTPGSNAAQLAAKALRAMRTHLPRFVLRRGRGRSGWASAISRSWPGPRGTASASASQIGERFGIGLNRTCRCLC